MFAIPVFSGEADPDSPQRLLERAAASVLRLSRPGSPGRLDDRTHAAVADRLYRMVDNVARQLAQQAAPALTRGLAARLSAAAAALAANASIDSPAWSEGFVAALVAETRFSHLCERFPLGSVPPGEPSVMVRFARHERPQLAAAARTLLLQSHPEVLDLAPDVLWFGVAALLRVATAETLGEAGALDVVLTSAVATRPPVASTADLYRAFVEELRAPPAVGTSNHHFLQHGLVLATAYLMEASELPFGSVRSLLLSGDSVLPLLLVHSLDLPYDVAPRFALAVQQAGGSNTLSRIATGVDALAEIAPAAARAIFAPLRAPTAYRHSLLALVPGERRVA